MLEKRHSAGSDAIILSGMLAILLMVSFSASAVTIASCPAFINDSSNLTANITAAASCIEFNATNIELDCQGFTIQGSNTGVGIRAVNMTGVVVRNCFVYNFTNNVRFENMTNSHVVSSLFGESQGQSLLILNSSGINVTNVVSFGAQGVPVGSSSQGISLWNVTSSSMTNVTGTANFSIGISVSGSGQGVFGNNITFRNVFGNSTSNSGISIIDMNDVFLFDSNGSAGSGTSHGIFVSGAKNIVMENVRGQSVNMGGFRFRSSFNITIRNSSGMSNASYSSALAENITNMTIYNFTGASTFGMGMNFSGIIESGSVVLKDIFLSTEAGIGFSCTDCRNVSIERMDVFSRNNTAIYLENASNVSIRQANASSSQGTGLLVNTSSRVSIVNMTIRTDLGTGLIVLSSANNTFDNLSISSNGSWVFTNGSYENNFTRLSMMDSNASVVFFSVVNFSNMANVSRSALNLSFNKAFLNSTNLSFLNIPGEVRFHRLGFSSPEELVDLDDDGTFASCPATRCTRVSYGDGTLTFHVTGWSAYSARESVAPPEQESSVQATPPSTAPLSRDGVQFTISSAEKVSVPVGDRSYIFDIIRINGKNGAEIAFGTALATITVGQTTPLDIDNDGKDDVTLKLADVTPKGIEVFIEPILAATPVNEPKSIPATQMPTAPGEKETPLPTEQPEGTPTPVTTPAQESPLEFKKGILSISLFAKIAAILAILTLITFFALHRKALFHGHMGKIE